MENRSIRTPGDLLKMLLRQRGWTQEELALVIGRSVKSISDVARGRSSVTPEMAACLAAAFGNTAIARIPLTPVPHRSILRGLTHESNPTGRVTSFPFWANCFPVYAFLRYFFAFASCSLLIIP